MLCAFAPLVPLSCVPYPQPCVHASAQHLTLLAPRLITAATPMSCAKDVQQTTTALAFLRKTSVQWYPARATFLARAPVTLSVPATPPQARAP